MSAPTLWEEGRMSGSRVTRLGVLLGLVLAALDLAVSQHLTPVFDVGFVLVCVFTALAVRPADFSRVAVLPPLLLLGLVTVVALAHRDWVADTSDPLVQAIVSGLAHHANALMVAYVLTLAVLGMRQRVRRLHAARQPKRSGSPAPTRVTSGAPEEKSTTVVGSEPHSPESTTASNQ